jgi:hypothetical protein
MRQESITTRTIRVPVVDLFLEPVVRSPMVHPLVVPMYAPVEVLFPDHPVRLPIRPVRVKDLPIVHPGRGMVVDVVCLQLAHEHTDTIIRIITRVTITIM